MKATLRAALIGLCALGLLSLVHLARDQAFEGPPALLYLLGVTPSFAAAIAIPFIFLSMWLETSAASSPDGVTKRFHILIVLSGIGLIGWEFGQTSSRGLVFDPHDLAATIVGLVVAWLLFRWIGR